MHKWLSAPPAPEDPPPRRTPRPHQARARHVGHPRARDDSQNRGGWGRSCSPASGTGSRKGPSPDGRLAGTGQRGCPLRSWRGGAPGARGKEGFCASPGGQGTLERRRCCSPAPESRVLGVGTLSVPPRPKHSGASPESLFLIKIQSCSISTYFTETVSCFYFHIPIPSPRRTHRALFKAHLRTEQNKNQSTAPLLKTFCYFPIALTTNPALSLC